MMTFPPLIAPSGDPQERNRKSDQFQLGTLTSVVLIHDYLCPWCWVGFLHARRLADEFGLVFDWRGFELIPPGMDFSAPPPRPAESDAPPRPPGRFEQFLVEEGIEMRSPRPAFARSHRALLGAEFARAENKFDAYNEAVYRAYWEERHDISDPAVLERLAATASLDPAAFSASVNTERFAENIVPFDDEAYALGIRHVPTFLFGAEEKLAEANYSDLAHAADRFLARAKKFQKGDAK